MSNLETGGSSGGGPQGLTRRPSRSAATTVFSTEVFDNEVVPSSLDSITRILRAATEIEHDRPRVAYLCRFYAFEKAHRLDPNSTGRGVRQFKTALHQRLERLWKIESDKEDGKIPTTTYQSSLSYHGSAVNAVRFSPSGEYLASGADGGELIIWKLHALETGQTWKVLKTLSFHRKDVLDLKWSTDGAFLISGSVDNSCIIWDVNKGSVHQILDAHFHYVQGVAWDPLGKYVASLSSDRTCRIYVNKPQKTKGSEKMNYVCQHVITKAEQLMTDDSKAAKNHLFHDETLASFFRRLDWSPDGSFLLVPAGSYKFSPTTEPVNTAYVFSRKDLSRPAIQLPGATKPVVAVRFCPLAFSLRGSNPASLFKLPYRLIFAVATLNSLYIYDTESVPPIAVLAGLHYAAITDIAWSPTAKFLALSSQDGYCTLIEFENDELGSPISSSEVGKFNITEKNIHAQNSDDMEIEASPNSNFVAADSLKAETERTEGKQGLASSTSTPLSTKPAKKRITPTAISPP